MERTFMHRGYARFAICALALLGSARVFAQAEPVAPPPIAAPVAPPPSAAPRDPSTGAPPTRDLGEKPPADAVKDPFATTPRIVQNSWHGSTGGVHVVDGSSGDVGTFRLQLSFDYFGANDMLLRGDHDEAIAGVLSLSATPIEHLEIFGSISSHANSNTLGKPQLLQVSGDVELGAKGHQQLLPWLSIGADARLVFLDAVGDLGVLFAGTSVGLRGAATADLRQLKDPLPVIFRANLGYLFDNSSQLIKSVEDQRYESLPPETRRSKENEDRHLVTRIERFALGINRVDMFNIGLGVESPLSIATNFFVHPLLEVQLGIPVNRQGYSCLSVPTNASIDGADGCLAITGLKAAPSTLTLGAKVLPPVPGLSALLAFDIGLSGTSTFVRELAPNRPWAFLMSLAYAVDTRKPEPEIHYVISSVRPPPVAAVKTMRVRGSVAERGFGTPIVGAVVRYPDLDLSPQLSGAEGRFTSYPLPPGEVVFEVTHPDYEPGRCVARIPAPNARPAPGVTAPVEPAGTPAPPPASPAVAAAAAAPVAKPAAPARAGVEAERFAEVHCELVARPRSGLLQGTVSGENNAPLPGIPIEISGTAARSLVSDASGAFSVTDLPPGSYVARVDAPNFLLQSQAFMLALGTDTTLSITLIAKPKVSQVQLTPSELRIGTQIMFKAASAEIDERSTPLLREIADTLQRNPQATHVQVQGHTDNRGDSAANQALSQQRAESVVRWLVDAGVDSSRLEAKGYGDSRPIVPNLTPDNRARNRRVQFMIRKAP
jgi:OmpA-OmpF porin, OOP family